MNILPHESEILLELARRAIRRHLSDLPIEDLTPDDPALHSPAGCFCSLHTRARHLLRGCVGTLEANFPLFQAVQHSARSVLEDPRFSYNPVQLPELSQLELELSILSPMAQAVDPLDFDLPSDGIYLTVDDRSGCFLPQVARETGWDKIKLLERLCTEKMQLPADAWKQSDATLWRFSTQILGPAAF